MNENMDDYFKYVGLVNLEFNKKLSSSKLSEVKDILFSPNTIKHIEFKDNVFKTVIPRNVKVSEAPSFGMSIIEYDPKSAGAGAYVKLGEEIIAKNK